MEIAARSPFSSSSATASSGYSSSTAAAVSAISSASTNIRPSYIFPARLASAAHYLISNCFDYYLSDMIVFSFVFWSSLLNPLIDRCRLSVSLTISPGTDSHQLLTLPCFGNCQGIRHSAVFWKL
jgi:hypothetical protein